jgi:hypothetical protein
VFLTPDTYTWVLLRRSPGGGLFSTWAAVKVVPFGVPLREPDDPAAVRLGAASLEAVGTASVPVPLAVGLSVPLGLLTSA